MSILIVKNISSEGPGTIEDFLVHNNMHYTVIDLERHAIDSADAYDTLVMLGGPMSVNNEAGYPYLTDEMRLAAQFIKAGKKVLGVCLGAQLMAKALGARVFVGAVKEIGWHDIELKDAGLQDPFMAQLAPDRKACKVFHWHGETFEIPQGAERLAASDLYPNQAFRYGTHAYAFQFHIEVTRQMIFDWLKNEPIDLKTLEQETDALYADYAARAEKFYKAFFLAG